jgi:hypothetical protein
MSVVRWPGEVAWMPPANMRATRTGEMGVSSHAARRAPNMKMRRATAWMTAGEMRHSTTWVAAAKVRMTSTAKVRMASTAKVATRMAAAGMSTSAWMLAGLGDR